jgi:hypothetical protein
MLSAMAYRLGCWVAMAKAPELRGLELNNDIWVGACCGGSIVRQQKVANKVVAHLATFHLPVNNSNQPYSA